MPGRGTVAAQHQRYFRKKGNFNHPRKIFGKQLLTQLKAWRAAGDEIILFTDLNENIYTGPIARQLQGDRILMREQTLLSTGKEAPHSHYTGKIAIVGTFATPGIKCTNSYLSPHGAGVGDHRFQLHDFNAHSILGTDYQKTVQPAGRALWCCVERTVKKYNKVLTQMLI